MKGQTFNLSWKIQNVISLDISKVTLDMVDDNMAAVFFVVVVFQFKMLHNKT